MLVDLADRRPQALSRELEQAEARDAADLDAGAVLLDRVAQPVLDRTLVLLRLHVDEVDDDQAAHVAQAHLAGDLVRSLEVGVAGRRLDVRAAGAARGVDVDRHQRLGVIDHDAAARGQRHLVRVRGLDLALDLVSREDRDVVVVELELAQVARHEALHVVLRLGEDLLLVDQDFTDVVGQVVAQRPQDRLALLVDQERGRAAVRCLRDRVPDVDQVVEVPLQFLGSAPDAGRAHDRAHPVRDLQVVHRLAQLVAVLALDAAGHAARPRVVRHQDQEAAGETHERGERCALVAALLLFDLDDQLLAFLDQFADTGSARLAVLGLEVLAGDFLERQEAMALGAIIDERGFEAGLYAGDSTLVDVGFLGFPGGNFDIEVINPLAVHQRNAQLLFLGCVDEHSLHRSSLNTSLGP